MESINKYDRVYYDIDVKGSDNEKIEIARLMKNLDIRIKEKYDLDANNNIGSFNKILMNSYLLDDELIILLKKEISKLNISYILTQFFIELTYEMYNKNDENRKKYMVSMLRLDLVKSIRLDEKEKAYYVILNNGKEYKIRRPIKEDADIEVLNKQCHKCTEEMLKDCLNDDGVFGCCVICNDLFNNPFYHSFIVLNNEYVCDLAHNIVTDLKLYTDELNYQILLKEEASKVLNGIENLKVVDKDFNESKLYNFLKYVIKNSKM